MADKGKKPFVSPVGAKNVAAAKAAWGGAAPPATAAKAEPAKPEPASKTAAANGEKKENAPAADPKAKTAAAAPATAGKGAPAAKEPVKEEPPAAAAAPPKPLHTTTNTRKQRDSDESSEASSDESDYSDSESESERVKAKKIDVGVSLSAIKAAFQQDNQARQQIKKGYDAEEFKREVKEATAATQECVAAENEPEATASDVIRGAVQSDLGLDIVKQANIKGTKNRFEQGLVNNDNQHEEKDELKELKNRSAVSGVNAKWEKPEELLSNAEQKQNDQDIEVAACKARKMKEKFERKAKKEEKKSKTPKPKSRTEPDNNAAAASAQRPYLQRSQEMTDRVVAELELVEMKRIIYK
ncbi:troponin I-like isoform X1 [Paramacrobiotus metropolitanus]|uniref:troponin I-like isoform X1 n=1 Tax=Paramacrobiotus metropolitanus TaxID=2943436 RepID=UPI002445C2A4|nr:troponin I-like isoform X1 [Paramacrobiotus metropolitanus]